MLLRKVLYYKMSAVLQYALLLVVVIKLIIPFGFESTLSPYNLLSNNPVNLTGDQSEDTQFASDMDSKYYSENIESLDPNLIINDSNKMSDNIVKSNKGDNLSITTIQTTWIPKWTELLLFLWIAGVVLMVFWLTFSQVYIKQRLKSNQVKVPEHVVFLVNECKEKLGIKRNIKIIIQKTVGVPIITGMIKPILILPDSLYDVNEEELRHVLIHELTHYKHGDLFIIQFMNFINSLYWFNPLVWICLTQIRNDMEALCDQRCLKMADIRDSYVETVLRFADHPILLNKRFHAALSINNGQIKMEKRIRNMSKRFKSEMSTKRISIVIAALMILCSLLTACQPTPENKVVVGKNDEITQSTIEYVKSNFPDTYQDSYSDKGADIIFDATVNLPESEQLACYTISTAPFTQAQADTIIHGLFGDQKLYDLAVVTKSEIKPEYIQALAELKDKQQNPTQYEASEAYYQERVDELKARINNAPETDILEPSDCKLKNSTSEKGVQYLSARGDLGKDQMAILKITSVDESANVGHDSYLEYINGTKYIDISEPYPNMLDNGPQNLKVTKDEAISMANNIVSQLGVEYMKYSGCATGVVYSNVGDYPETISSQMPQSFLIYYTRNINGVQITYDQRRYSYSSTDDSYSSSEYYERIVVAVDDSGVSYIRWQGPVSIGSVSADNNQIISFEDMMILAKEQLSYEYATFEYQERASENITVAQAQLETTNYGKIMSNQVHIQKITLGLMQIPTQNGGNEYIPVWDFFGYSQANYENGQEKQYGNNKSILTINAINGTVIDRDLGY